MGLHTERKEEHKERGRGTQAEEDVRKYNALIKLEKTKEEKEGGEREDGSEGFRRHGQGWCSVGVMNTVKGETHASLAIRR